MIWPIDDDTDEGPRDCGEGCPCEECRALRFATDADRAYDERFDIND
jgi:hypothetical protein